jgi:hypothetical protein
VDGHLGVTDAEEATRRLCAAVPSPPAAQVDWLIARLERARDAEERRQDA